MAKTLETSIQKRFSDVDPFQHVNNVSQQMYFDVGKMEYYEKILASKPLAADYLNAGHVAWRTGKIEKAAELYSKAALEYGGQEIFREMFGKDKETLVRQGISEKDIPLMMDLV